MDSIGSHVTCNYFKKFDHGVSVFAKARLNFVWLRLKLFINLPHLKVISIADVVQQSTGRRRISNSELWLSVAMVNDHWSIGHN